MDDKRNSLSTVQQSDHEHECKHKLDVSIPWDQRQVSQPGPNGCMQHHAQARNSRGLLVCLLSFVEQTLESVVS